MSIGFGLLPNTLSCRYVVQNDDEEDIALPFCPFKSFATHTSKIGWKPVPMLLITSTFFSLKKCLMFRHCRTQLLGIKLFR